MNVKMNKSKYDLEERTGRFGEAIIKFSQKIPKDCTTRPIISQLVRAGTSVGANYCEADNAESRADFKHKISISKKESKETKHWLKMVTVAVPTLQDDSNELIQEATELTLIFNAIVNSTKRNGKALM